MSGSGAGGFGLGTFNLGACLTIGTDGKVRCPNGLYNGSGIRIARVNEIMTISPQVPTVAPGVSYQFAVDSVGNSYALCSSDTINIYQEQFGTDGLPITFSLAKSYVGNVSINTRDSHNYIQLGLTPDDTGTDQTLNLEYTPLLTKLSTLLDQTVASNTYQTIDGMSNYLTTAAAAQIQLTPGHKA